LIFSSFTVQKLLNQAQLDQPLISGRYSNLARIAKTDLAVNRPNGPISKNPLSRYIELRVAMEFLYSPSNHTSFSQERWRITWNEMLSEAIPDDEIEVFCSLLFASSLLSVVRYWYAVDAVNNCSGPPIRDQWTPELRNSQNFQGNYYAPADCGVRFSRDLESTIKPIYGILSSAYSVISPHCLPTSILDRHFHGRRSTPPYCFESDKYTDVFKQGLKVIIDECRKQIFELSPEGQSKGTLLMDLLCLEASRRYHVTF
jgi:hypothetical protein